MNINKNDTAVLITDPQNDFLSEKGVTWKLVGDSVKENKTIENIERLFKAAKKNGFDVFISPHYYYPTDHSWKFEGTLEKVMHEIKMFDRRGALSLDGFSGSGADWLERYKPFIEDGKTIVVGPHKVYGPENNDLILQLGKRNIRKVLVGGMSANLCVESHMRELIERGFEVTVVKDATAGARHPELGDGYKAALVNFGYIANAVLSTDEVVKVMGANGASAAAVAL
jgi:nicotinamidase-related amidase